MRTRWVVRETCNNVTRAVSGHAFHWTARYSQRARQRRNRSQERQFAAAGITLVAAKYTVGRADLVDLAHLSMYQGWR